SGAPLPANASRGAAPTAPAATSPASTRRRAGDGAVPVRWWIVAAIAAPSAALELGREQQQRERLRRVGGALELARGFVAAQRAEAAFGEATRVDDAAGALGDARRPLDALPHGVWTEPVVGAVAPA